MNACISWERTTGELFPVAEAWIRDWDFG